MYLGYSHGPPAFIHMSQFPFPVIIGKCLLNNGWGPLTQNIGSAEADGIANGVE